MQHPITAGEAIYAKMVVKKPGLEMEQLMSELDLTVSAGVRRSVIPLLGPLSYPLPPLILLPSALSATMTSACPLPPLLAHSHPC